MGVNERLFHLMAEKMHELACDAPRFEPDDDDVSEVLVALSVLVGNSADRDSAINRTAAAALEVAAGEYSTDLGYHINERMDSYERLLECMADGGVLTRACEDSDYKLYLLER